MRVLLWGYVAISVVAGLYYAYGEAQAREVNKVFGWHHPLWNVFAVLLFGALLWPVAVAAYAWHQLKGWLNS